MRSFARSPWTSSREFLPATFERRLGRSNPTMRVIRKSGGSSFAHERDATMPAAAAALAEARNSLRFMSVQPWSDVSECETYVGVTTQTAHQQYQGACLRHRGFGGSGQPC